MSKTTWTKLAIAAGSLALVAAVALPLQAEARKGGTCGTEAKAACATEAKEACDKEAKADCDKEAKAACGSEAKPACGPRKCN